SPPRLIIFSLADRRSWIVLAVSARVIRFFDTAPIVFGETELVLIEPRPAANRNAMATQRAFVMPALRLVVEDSREIPGERHASNFFDAAVVEELVKQCLTSFVHHALAPPRFLADKNIKHSPSMKRLNLEPEKSDLHLSC